MSLSLFVCVCVCLFIYFASTLISLIKHLFQASLSNASKKKTSQKNKLRQNMSTVKNLKTKQKVWLVNIAKLAKKHVHMFFIVQSDFVNRKKLNETIFMLQ